MKFLRHVTAVCGLFFSVSGAAIISSENGYSSAENVITLDQSVVGIQQFLQRNKYKPLSTVTKPTYYIVTPTEASYQTAHTVITMVDNSAGKPVEYANVIIPIIYNAKSDTYSAGKVSVKYSATRVRL